MISLMTSGGVALWVAVLSTPVLIRWLIKNNIGQQIREDGPQVHIAKAGTPTMGGIGIVAAVVIGLRSPPTPYRGSVSRRSGLLIMLAIVGAGSIGFADDWIKVRHRRSLGLNKRAKFGAQIGARPALRAPGRALGPRLDGAVLHPLRLHRAPHRAPPSGWCGPR